MNLGPAIRAYLQVRHKDHGVGPGTRIRALKMALLVAQLTAFRSQTHGLARLCWLLVYGREGAKLMTLEDELRARIAVLEEALETIRSGLRNLPASATAVQIDKIAATALTKEKK